MKLKVFECTGCGERTSAFRKPEDNSPPRECVTCKRPAAYLKQVETGR